MKRLIARVGCWLCRRRGPIGPPPVPPGRVEVTTAELDALLADINNGMNALRERVEELELSLRLETALLEAVLRRD
jgi:hypothetical protein